MKQNMGTIDRAVRIVLAIAAAMFYFSGKMTGTCATILGIFAAVFLLTSAVGFCPLYVPLKISTKKKGA